MKKRKLLIVLVMSMLAFSGCGTEADGQNAAETTVSASERESAVSADNVSNESAFDASGEETENSIAETNQTKDNETAETNDDGTDEMNSLEIDKAEFIVTEATDIDEPEESASASTDNELPSTELCVGLAKEIFEQTNAERVAAGLPELVWSDELAIAADIRAEEIITDFSHVRPNGEKCYSLGDNVHGENIARGPHADGSEFVAHWMDSEGHRANILRAEVFTAIGVGTRCTELGDTAVQIFGTY